MHLPGVYSIIMLLRLLLSNTECCNSPGVIYLTPKLFTHLEPWQKEPWSVWEKYSPLLYLWFRKIWLCSSSLSLPCVFRQSSEMDRMEMRRMIPPIWKPQMTQCPPTTASFRVQRAFVKFHPGEYSKYYQYINISTPIANICKHLQLQGFANFAKPAELKTSSAAFWFRDRGCFPFLNA